MHFYPVVDAVYEPGVHIVGVDLDLAVVGKKEEEGLTGHIQSLGTGHRDNLHRHCRDNLITLIISHQQYFSFLRIIIQFHNLLAFLIEIAYKKSSFLDNKFQIPITFPYNMIILFNISITKDMVYVDTFMHVQDVQETGIYVEILRD